MNVLPACGNDADSDASSFGAPSCADVCDHVETVCGAAGACASLCSDWSAALRRCADGISTCEDLDSCEASSSSSSGGDDTSDAGSSKADSSSSSPSGGNDAASSCPTGCTAAPSEDQAFCAAYAGAGDGNAYHCCGGATPDEADSNLTCQGPNTNGVDFYYCCSE